MEWKVWKTCHWCGWAMEKSRKIYKVANSISGMSAFPCSPKSFTLHLSPSYAYSTSLKTSMSIWLHLIAQDVAINVALVVDFANTKIPGILYFQLLLNQLNTRVFLTSGSMVWLTMLGWLSDNNLYQHDPVMKMENFSKNLIFQPHQLKLLTPIRRTRGHLFKIV